MKILVLNCGSSSIKYQLLDMENESLLAKGLLERIGLPDSILTHQATGQDKYRQVMPVKDHTEGVKQVLHILFDAERGVISDAKEIAAVGHRVVHAGEEFSGSVLITPQVKAALQRCVSLAPLHNPPNLLGIEAAEQALPGTPQVGVFDTAFHQTMPQHVYLYALPYELYEKYGIRRYGFHGTSHRYVAQRAAEMLGKPLPDLKLITCHLGNGCSITAVAEGKSFDTSMGMTPLEGLVMGTRSGDVDPAVLPWVMREEGLDTDQIDNLINKKSGLLGVSGISNDMREVEEAASAGHKRARLAYDMFIYRLRKYIGAYAAAMGGVDALVFTAGIGENSASVRSAACSGLGFLGVAIDEEKNRSQEREKDIALPEAKVRVLVIPTNEELVIARDTAEIVQQNQ
ncbi:MAG TPA: acetate kinase [Firmicutes bacterium]|nr:acetate kinase [Bacillota bacterium]